MPDDGETPETPDGEEPPKKTPSRKSKKSKKATPKMEEKRKSEEPQISPITHEPVVMADSALPPPQATPSLGQLQISRPRVRDFWVCCGLLLIFAILCGIGFAILHSSTFGPGREKNRLMTANRQMELHGAITVEKGQDPTSSSPSAESPTTEGSATTSTAPP